MQRLFVAINLEEGIKEELASHRPDIPAKWVSKNNLHITLAFIGDADSLKIKEKIKEVVLKHKPFALKLDKISYGPLGIIPPRMVWATGEATKEFLNLKKDLEKALSTKKEEPVLHVTLARIKEWEWRRIEPDERPEIEEFLDIDVIVSSVELMESVLRRTGAEYTVLESYKL